MTIKRLVLKQLTITNLSLVILTGLQLFSNTLVAAAPSYNPNPSTSTVLSALPKDSTAVTAMPLGAKSSLPLSTTTATKLTVPATFSESVTSSSPVTGVSYYLNNKLLSTITTIPYSYNLNTKSYLNGNYTLKLKTYFLNGKTSSSSYSLVIANPYSLTQFRLSLDHSALVVVIVLIIILASILYMLRDRLKQPSKKIKTKDMTAKQFVVEPQTAVSSSPSGSTVRYSSTAQRVIPILLIVLGVAILGHQLLSDSHAATPYGSVLAINGALTNGATKSSDQSSVVFGTVGTSTTTGGSSTNGTGTSSTEGGCSSGGVVAPCIGGATTGASGWGTPVFDDEFTKDSSLNTSLWSPTVYFGGDVQNFTTIAPSNVSVANGDLNLWAYGAAGQSGSFMDTDPGSAAGQTGFQFTYGYMEARINFAASGNEIANWPSFWLTGNLWPNDGEIDVVEGLGGQACYHFHWGPSVADAQALGNCVNGNYAGGWHTFGANWQPGIVTWYYDGVQVGTISGSEIASDPLFLMLENVTGCASNGCFGLSPVTTPADVQVQYVRVWQK